MIADCGNLSIPQGLTDSPKLKHLMSPNLNFLSNANWAESLKSELDSFIVRHESRYEIPSNVSVSGNLLFGTQVVLLPGTVVEGPCVIGSGTVIGPNAFIRPGTVVGDSVKIGFGVEVKCSILFDNCAINHHSYVGHSMIGQGVNIGAGVILAARRLDNKRVRLATPRGCISTAQLKLGSIIERDAVLGVGLRLMPGSWVARGIHLRPKSYSSGFLSGTDVGSD
jgi:bifunctional UDP-N-acetylglucosamine pyrophosphorylase/glucosamine-1-phosphate N-acetyltransferase